MAEHDLTFGGQLRHIRQKLKRWPGMTQQEFAKRFGLSAGSVRDLEQGRFNPTAALRVLVAAIDLDAELIDRAVVLANERKRLEPTKERPE